GQVHETLGQLDWLVTLVGVEPEHEVRLQVRNILGQLCEVRGNPVDLRHPAGTADTSLVGVVGPRLDTRRDHGTVRFLQPLRPVTAQYGERAFDDVRRSFA